MWNQGFLEFLKLWLFHPLHPFQVTIGSCNTFRARKMFFLFFMFFKERDLFFCSLENAFLGQMFFIFRKYYILIHKAMISWPIMLTLSPPQSHPVPDFTIVTLKWHNTTLNCHCHLSSLLTGMLIISEILLNMIVMSLLFPVCYQNWLPCLKQEHQICLKSSTTVCFKSRH